MQTSVYIARLIGPVFLAVGIGALVNAAVYKKFAAQFLDNIALIFVSGILLMTAGMAVLLAHNVWVAEWRVLITLLGWIAAIAGALRIVMPQGTESVGRRILKHPQGLTIAAVIWLALGAVLCFFGYFR
jgi:uncharacterized membrane protein